MESRNSTFRLESFCTVFQAEMFALHGAIKRSRRQGSAGQHLQRLKVVAADADRPKTHNPLAHAAPRHQGYRCGRQEVRLFWVRAHAGTTGNERADELARNAALKRKRQRITIAIRCRTPKGDQGGEPGRVATALHRGRHW
ncbi:hypothetical protein EVAR_82178_1 [Eumeta japonica]|uniref:RNase H type-1 domain-containing protein n=1 Tax=Eumeta variegata TaxID=151549 RepID=A0A4C2AFL2_EUMVA|nr:hypothetical protein EVAR_82178_1 [Eumeta japonica]